MIRRARLYKSYARQQSCFFGVKPIWVAIELDAAYQTMSAHVTFPAEAIPRDPSERKATFSGVTVAPTGAIIGKFW